MSVEVKYTGTSNFRVIEKKDWEENDVTDQEKVEWERDSKTKIIQTISDSAWELIKDDPDFKLATDAQVAKASEDDEFEPVDGSPKKRR